INKNNETIVEYLIEHSADVNKIDPITNNFGCYNPLIGVHYSRNDDIIEYLIENDTDISQTNSSGETPLNVAIKKKI
ncbi:ankyrin, partial [Neocallimastix sp. 'constans']